MKVKTFILVFLFGLLHVFVCTSVLNAEEMKKDANMNPPQASVSLERPNLLTIETLLKINETLLTNNNNLIQDNMNLTSTNMILSQSNLELSEKNSSLQLDLDYLVQKETQVKSKTNWGLIGTVALACVASFGVGFIVGVNVK